MNDSVAARIGESLTQILGADYHERGINASGGNVQRSRLNHRLAALEMRRQENIEEVISMAYLVGGKENADEDAPELDDDWLARFVGHAQEISNPVMLSVWGQILAHEAQTPGRFSLGTLDVLSSMTGMDWLTWKQASKLCFPTGYILKLGARNDFDEFGLSREDIARLQALDLVQQTDDLCVTFHAPSKGLTFDFAGADLVVRHPKSTLFTLPAYCITGVARELFIHLDCVSADMGYLQALGKALRADSYDFRLHKAA
jgi:hypothetical protein